MSIELKNIAKSYHNNIVINSISLSIPSGKIVSLLGPNGSGKSTLFSIISRLIQPDSGEIFLDGQNLRAMKNPDIAKKVGILRQSNHTDLRLSIEELVACGRFPHSQGRLNSTDHTYINQAIKYMGLENIRHKYLHELSGGQKQRAYVAMILAQDTDYILLDEPLNNLDIRYATQFMQTLRDLVHNHGKSISVVLHDINFASIFSDHIFALKAGILVYQGTPDDMMNTDTLESIFGFKMPVHKIDGHKLGLYFLS